MTSNAYNALLAIGANEPMKKEFRGSFAIIGFKGKPKPGFVKQVRLKNLLIGITIVALPLTWEVGREE